VEDNFFHALGEAC